MQEEKWKLVGFILASKYRYLVLKHLNKTNAIPSKIAETLDIHLGHISNLLKELAIRELIVCLNPKSKKGRIYSITTKGKEILNEVNKII